MRILACVFGMALGLVGCVGSSGGGGGDDGTGGGSNERAYCEKIISCFGGDLDQCLEQNDSISTDCLTCTRDTPCDALDTCEVRCGAGT